LVLFADQPYSISGGLNYRKYSLKEFREHRIRRTKKRIKNEVAELEKKGLIQTKDDLIAYNYKYNKKRYVKIPHKYAELIFSGKIKASEVKVLFAILLLLYSDLSNQKSVYDMGTRKKKITTKQLKKLTGKSKPTIRRSIRKLEKKNIIIYTARNGKRDGNLFEIAYDNSNKISKKKKQKKSKNRKKKKNKQN
jgi:DNA-binding MarR family transcriptional regulator